VLPGRSGLVGTARVAANIEAEILDRGIVAVGVDPRGNAGLHALAHRPVLPVDEIPGNRRRPTGRSRRGPSLRGETGSGIRSACGRRPGARARTRRHGRSETLSIRLGSMSSPLWRTFSSSGEPGEGGASGGAVHGVGIGALAVRDAGFPIQIDPAALLEGRHDSGQLRVDTGAVVALVVVLEDQLPVGVQLVADRLCGAQISRRDRPLASARRIGQFCLEIRRGLGREVDEHEPAPDRDANGMQRKHRFSKPGVSCNCGAASGRPSSA